MTQPSFSQPTPSDLLPLSQIPLRHRKSVLDWLEHRVLDCNEKPVIPHGIYEFWLDNISHHSTTEPLLDF
jgi:hypothetical protein